MEDVLRFLDVSPRCFCSSSVQHSSLGAASVYCTSSNNMGSAERNDYDVGKGEHNYAMETVEGTGTARDVADMARMGKAQELKVSIT